MTFAIVACLIAAAGLAGDHYATMLALGNGAREKNGIARWILARANPLWLLAFNAVVLGGAAWALCYLISPAISSGYLMLAGLIKGFFGWNNYRLARGL